MLYRDGSSSTTGGKRSHQLSASLRASGKLGMSPGSCNIVPRLPSFIQKTTLSNIVLQNHSAEVCMGCPLKIQGTRQVVKRFCLCSCQEGLRRKTRGQGFCWSVHVCSTCSLCSDTMCMKAMCVACPMPVSMTTYGVMELCQEVWCDW